MYPNSENKIFTNLAIYYSSAREGRVAAGGLFWQLLIEGPATFAMAMRFNESPSTASVIAEQSPKKLNSETRKGIKLEDPSDDEGSNETPMADIYSCTNVDKAIRFFYVKSELNCLFTQEKWHLNFMEVESSSIFL